MKVGVISNVESCIPLLQYLRSGNNEVVLYIGLSNDQSHHSSLISFCNASQISVIVEENTLQLYDWIHLQKPDYCFVYGYKKLIDVHKLGKYKESIFNIHPGKLPNYRGASPIFWQLKNGEKQLGIAIHFLNEKFDEGAIVWQKEIANEKHFSYGLVEMIFANLLVEGVHFVLHKSKEQLMEIQKAQNEKEANRFHKPSLQDVLIDFQKMNATQIVDLVRACNPWNKGAISVCNGMEIKIIDAEIDITQSDKLPGTIVDTANCVKIVAANNSLVAIHQMNMNGIFVPGRFANLFGLMIGHRFILP